MPITMKAWRIPFPNLAGSPDSEEREKGHEGKDVVETAAARNR